MRDLHRRAPTRRDTYPAATTAPDELRAEIVIATPLATEHARAVRHAFESRVGQRSVATFGRLERKHARVVITKHGRPAAVLLSVDDLASFEETLEILSNRQLMTDIRDAEAEAVAGQTSTLSKDEALAQLRPS